VRSRKEQYFFNCRTGAMATNRIVGYPRFDGGGGNTVSSWSANPRSLQYKDVVPDSFGEMMLNMACGRTPKPKRNN
jgi:hypothetical protein